MKALLAALDGKKSWTGYVMVLLGVVVVVVKNLMLTESDLDKSVGIPLILAGAATLGIGAADKVRKLTDEVKGK